MQYPIRIMLTGIAVILIGIFVQLDSGNDWHGSAFLFEIVGFLLVLGGLLFDLINRD